MQWEAVEAITMMPPVAEVEVDVEADIMAVVAHTAADIVIMAMDIIVAVIDTIEEVETVTATMDEEMAEDDINQSEQLLEHVTE